MEDVISAMVDEIDNAIVVDPVEVLGTFDKVDDICSGEVSGVDNIQLWKPLNQLKKKTSTLP